MHRRPICKTNRITQPVPLCLLQMLNIGTIIIILKKYSNVAHILYRGLPSDDGDDILTGDISALHLSDYDVYAQTGGRKSNANTFNQRGI